MYANYLKELFIYNVPIFLIQKFDCKSYIKMVWLHWHQYHKLFYPPDGRGENCEVNVNTMQEGDEFSEGWGG